MPKLWKQIKFPYHKSVNRELLPIKELFINVRKETIWRQSNLQGR